MKKNISIIVACIVVILVFLISIMESEWEITISIIGAGTSVIGLVITIGVLINSENIKQFIENQNKKQLLSENKNLFSISVDLQAISNLLSTKEYEKIGIENIKNKLHGKMGRLDAFKSIFGKKAKKAINILSLDELYADENVSTLCYNIGVVLTEIELLTNKER